MKVFKYFDLTAKACAIALMVVKVFYCHDVQAQCNIVPVKEAVINGDFEKRYIDRPTDFYTDGVWPKNTMMRIYDPANRDGNCYYATRDAFWVGSTADTFYCENRTNVGFGFCPGCFEISGDRTPGKDGKGNFLVADTYVSPIAGYEPIIWNQTVDVYSFQTYYFSAWAANWMKSGTNAPQLKFYVQGIRSDGTKGALVQLTMSDGADYFEIPSGDWVQFHSSWESGDFVKAELWIRNRRNIEAGNDLGIDDISFINSCANVTDLAYAPDLGPDVSLCMNEGKVLLNPKVALNGSLRGFSWFKRNGSTYTPIVENSTTQNTMEVTEAGIYRVCVFESGSCVASDEIEVNLEMFLNLGNDVELCSEMNLTLVTGFKTDDVTLSYAWSKNGTPIAGADKPTLTVDAIGEYAVTVSSSVVGCAALNDNIRVTSPLPALPPVVDYCPGKDVMLSIEDAGGEYNWFATRTGGTPLATNTTSYTTKFSGGDTALYVEDAKRIHYTTGVPKANMVSGGFGITAENHVFNVIQKLRLEGASVRTGDQNAFTLTVEVVPAGGGAAVASKVFNFPANSHDRWLDLDLGFDLDPGKYRLRHSGVQLYFRNGNAPGGVPGGYPGGVNPVPGVITIESSYPLGDWNYNAYAPFYEWKVSTGKECGRVPVRAAENCPCNPPEQVVITQGDTVRLCPGEEITLSTSEQDDADLYIFKWLKGSYPGGELVEGPETDILYLEHKVVHTTEDHWYYALVYDKNTDGNTESCRSIDSVYVVSMPEPTVTLEQVPAPSCSDVPAKIAAVHNGGSGAVFNWKVDGVAQVPTKDTLVLNDPVDEMLIEVEMIPQYACLDPKNPTADLTLNIEPVPVLSKIKEESGTVCTPDTILTAEPVDMMFTVEWRKRAGDPGILEVRHRDTLEVKDLQQGDTTWIYRVVSSGTACEPKVDSLWLRLGKQPSMATATTTTPLICLPNNKVMLQGSAFASDETVNWSSPTGADVLQPNSRNTETNALTVGEHIFLYMITNDDCGSADMVLVTVEPEPVQPVLAKDSIITCADAVQLNATVAQPDGMEGRWSIVRGSAVIADDQDPQSMLTDINVPGVVELRWTVSNSCEGKYATLIVEKLSTASVAKVEGEFNGTSVDISNDTLFLCVGKTVPFKGIAHPYAKGGKWLVEGASATVDKNIGDQTTMTVVDMGLSVVKWVPDQVADCPEDTVKVFIRSNDRPKNLSPITGPSKVCPGAVAGLNISPVEGAFDYHWTYPADVTLVSGQGTTDIVLSFGDDALGGEVTVKAENECGLSETVTRQVEVEPLPQVSIAGDEMFCPGGTGTLSSSITGPGHSYRWFRNGTEVIGEIGPSITTGQEATYEVEVTTDLGCVGRSSAHDLEMFIGGIAITTESGSFTKCEGEALALTVEQVRGASAIDWYHEDALIFSGLTTIPAIQPGNYRVEVKVGVGANICSDVTWQVVDDIPKPQPVINEASQVICEGTTITLTTTTLPGTMLQWYKDGQAIFRANNNSVQVNSTGLYTVEEILGGNCAGMSPPVQVEVVSLPVANAGRDIYVKPGELIELNGSGSQYAESFKWTLPHDSQWSATGVRVQLQATKEATYHLTAYSKDEACSHSDSVTVHLEFPVKAWNSLSPNGDGVFDEWVIEKISDYPDCVVEVYNRMGSLVWRSVGYNTPWRGEALNGGMLPVATYYYVIHLNGQSGTVPVSGHVTIIK